MSFPLKFEVDPNFEWDFESEIEELAGLTRLNRLVNIYTRGFGNFRDRALRMLTQSLLKSSCTGFVKRLPTDLSAVLLMMPEVNNWEVSTDLSMTQILSVLEQDLNAARTAAVKESIRASYFELGLHYFNWGRIEEAIKMFFKARDFSSGQQQQLDLALRLLACYLELGQLLNAASFAAKLTESPDALTKRRAHALIGLIALSDHNYASSTSSLVKMSLPEDIVGDGSWNFVFSRFDVGFVGAISGWMSLNRNELLEHMLHNPHCNPNPTNNKHFAKHYLSAQPVALQRLSEEVLGQYRYTSAVQSLQWLHTRLLLDPTWLVAGSGSTAVPAEVVSRVLSRLLAQYLRPFASVQVSRVAADFQLPESTTQQLLVHLATHRSSSSSEAPLQLKIDFAAGLVHTAAHSPASTSSSSSSAIELQGAAQAQLLGGVRRALLLLSLQRKGLCVESPQAGAASAAVRGRQRPGARARSRPGSGGYGGNSNNSSNNNNNNNSGEVAGAVSARALDVDADEEGMDDREADDDDADEELAEVHRGSARASPEVL